MDFERLHVIESAKLTLPERRMGPLPASNIHRPQNLIFWRFPQMRKLLLSVVVLFCFAVAGLSQQATRTEKAKAEAKEAAQATKEGTVKAAKATKNATVKVAKATKDGTVKVSKKVAAGTKKAAIATKDAVTGNKHDDSHLIDLNTASREQLVALPGVGEVYAQKIINGRPYANKAQLVSRGIVPGNSYAQFHQQVIARQ